MKYRLLTIYNPYYHNAHQLTSLCAALEELGIENQAVSALYVVQNGVARVHGYNGESHAVFLDKDVYLGRTLEQLGCRLFNSISSIELCDDKNLTHLALGGLPMPKTVMSRQSFGWGADDITVEFCERELEYPMVFKTAKGSLGEGVRLVKDRNALVEAISASRDGFLVQRFVEECKGSDIRVMVIGGKAVGAMKRQGSFRAGIASGGSGSPFPLTDEIVELSQTCATRLGLDFAGVDILPSNSGALVSEVNSNAHFEEFSKVTGIDVAKLYAKHIMDCMKQ